MRPAPRLCICMCAIPRPARPRAIPRSIAKQATRLQAVAVKPEIECFELGHVWLAKQLIAEGLSDPPPLFQLCLGIPWGAEATTAAMLAMRHHLPPNANWAGFAIGL